MVPGPVLTIDRHKPPQNTLERLVITLHKAICLRVVWGGPDALDAQQMIDLLHSLRQKAVPWSGQEQL